MSRQHLCSQDYEPLLYQGTTLKVEEPFFKDPETKTCKRYEPWMTPIVDLDSGQVLGMADGRDSRGGGDWLFARPLAWRLGVEVVTINTSAAFRKAQRM